MSNLLIASLIIEVVAVAIVLAAVGRRWLSHIGAIFIIIAFVVHGLIEIAQVLFPGRSYYRLVLDQDKIDSWVIIASLAMLIFALAYFISLRKFQVTSYSDEEKKTEMDRKSVLPDWRIMLFMAIPVYFIAIGSLQDTTSYWLPGISQQFVILLISLTSVSFILALRNNLIIPVMRSEERRVGKECRSGWSRYQ